MIIFELLPGLLPGVRITLLLTALSASLALIIAFIVGFARLSKYRPVRFLATVFVEFFRGTSLLVQLFWAYFVLPFFGIELTAMQAGVLTLGLHYGAYASEIVRSSILAIPKGQTEAGISLNMTRVQIMQRIILPQAFLRMLPPFGNTFIEMLKGTSLVSLITLSDLMFQGVMIRSTTLRTTETFALVLLLYFIIAIPFTLGVRWLERTLVRGRA
ncbi:ectoine/hydroxyectoine ABC transporter permease subunit EhuC [Desulforamulus aquiferis]|uniref:ectoine/hydroxyectoine ABC transporter permease subunit EhuC n=1 Tax=Desulforamulus aquiferis TaxID=1397668 RepID=UPI002714A7EC|nr:ectoine/hydroxyectoine ABC transporter permease subunit EhuC [Desulforamulus aquiferis]